MLAVGLSYIAFITLKCVPCISICYRFYKRIWVLSGIFFCICWDDHICFVLLFCGISCLLICVLLSHSFHPWINTTYSYCLICACILEFDLLLFCWGFLQRELVFYAILEKLFFSYAILIWFGTKVILGFINLYGNFLFSIFMEKLSTWEQVLIL